MTKTTRNAIITPGFLVEMVKKIYETAGNNQQLSFFGDDILNQLDEAEPLLELASVILWPTI